ncbi:ClpX C4-type zinc finger protein [Roseococcus microcysteis]|uniref:ClpX C4-type zinc finger protein n=1 Tax=Roseococcus microcysteis TaxID=2771361 RepID=UPI00168A4844|nr:ClpX C4-type zinc finger protein [Roseococcus microcysteis]
MTVKERVQGAIRILFGRKENVPTCSFCGRSRLSGETIVAGPGVAICESCAFMALDQVATQNDPAAPQGLIEIGLMPLYEAVCLLPAQRATLADDLAAAAARVPCHLLGWSYSCSSRTGDYLAVRVACTEDVDKDLVPERFHAALFSNDVAASRGGMP